MPPKTLVLTLLFPALMLAHHGGAEYDLGKTVEFKGKLTKVDFINPHSWLYFDVTEAGGNGSHHRCEMRSVHVLRRSGWTKESFPVGQQVTIEASPNRTDPASCYLQTIVFADGTRMDRYGQYVKAAQGGIQEVRGPITTPKKDRPLRRASGEPNISGEWAPIQQVMVDPRGTGGGLVALNTLDQYKPGERPNAKGGAKGKAAPTGPRLYGGTELTEAGEKAAAAFKRDDTPRFHCQTTSIVFDWTFDGPVNRITQNKDTIVLEYGQFGFKRTVYMNLKEHPANVKPSRAGHSIGHWEGDTLVVDTTGFLPGFLNTPVPNSDKLHVVERFTLDPEKLALTRAYTAEDPVYLKGKYTGSDAFTRPMLRSARASARN
ncbi:MAG: hypothetical protein JO307_09385 [Bryobacterales bacterium]|nr:hypothetical protein [Bryobacterales bacterium]MBV9397937.1 hypothetical protein [Bryobacterales bacterium]